LTGSPRFPEPEQARLQAGIFASDLLAKCQEVFEVFAPRREPGEVNGVPVELVRLPITIPVNDSGLVLLGPPTILEHKRPATMEVVRVSDRRSPYRFGIHLLPLDGEPLLIPGVNPAGRLDQPPLPLHALSFALAGTGFAVVGFGPDGEPAPVSPSEDTARELANALLLSLGLKLVKAERGED
jgi:hypothetical protein